MSKPNKDGWIRHRGGKCPVGAGALVDVKHRNGDIFYGESALEGFAETWSHSRHRADIMAYRPYKPAEQPVIEPAVVANVQAFNAQAELLYDPVAQGPLQWRDRITEIYRTVEALEEERVPLVQRLEAEGFRLIERAVQPVEDMSNPKNWEVGDVFAQIAEGSWRHSDGTLWTMTHDDGTDMRTYRADTGSDRYVKDFALKFHSRPSK